MKKLSASMRVNAGFPESTIRQRNMADPHGFPQGKVVCVVGSDPISDGSAARIELYGVEQYFWGDAGTGDSVPLVKIVTAQTAEVVDAAIIFNPDFVDLTYGTGSEGWNPNRPHTWRDIVISDHDAARYDRVRPERVLGTRGRRNGGKKEGWLRKYRRCVQRLA